MTQRKENDRQKHRTRQEMATLAQQEAQANALGVPRLPDQYVSNNRALYALWLKNGQRLLEARLLSYADGPALLGLCRAQLAGQTDLAREIAAKTWGSRVPFPDPNPPSGELTLEAFIEQVKLERLTFEQRMRPAQTVCLDSTGEYTWPDGDAAEVARRYALEVVQGKIIAGELVRRACQRFLADLEVGSTRGVYLDPVAARHIVQWCEVFCDLKPLPWQVFILANLFGWKMPSGTRRFSEAWVSCGKKSGKTRLCSCIALFGLVADQEKYPEIYSAATKKEQARLVWRDAKRAISNSPELQKRVKRWSGSLAVAETDGSFEPLSSDTKSMDGLRPHFIIADEVAFWEDREQWDKLTKGVVSRPQPLTVAITTAGKTKNCFAWGKFDLASKILEGVYPAERTFVAVYSLDKEDSWKDESVWLKANPSLGVTLELQHLKKTAEEVAQDSSGLNAFQQYHCNLWVEFRQGRSIPAAKWDLCRGYPDLPDLNPRQLLDEFLKYNLQEPCFGGLDLGLVSDFSAFVLLFPRVKLGSGETLAKTVVVPFFWLPEAGLLEKERQWQVPLSIWVREQWIRLQPGDLADPRLIRDNVKDLCQRMKIQSVGFDPWQAKILAAELQEAQVVEMVETPQKPSVLTTPAREFKRAVFAGELWHLNNPVLRWMAGNVALVENERHGGLMPEKLSPHEKIDAIQAAVIAWSRMLCPPAPPPRVHFIDLHP
jgi:phage terminase large subunit-like protein